MADKSPPDLGESFRDLVTQWEREFNAFANQIMGTESFSRAMNQTQKSTLGIQQVFSDAMGRHFAAMNLPTRDDVVHLSQSLQEVHRRLERVEALLEAHGTASASSTGVEAVAAGGVGATPAKGPPRTRRPPGEYFSEPQPAGGQR